MNYQQTDHDCSLSDTDGCPICELAYDTLDEDLEYPSIELVLTADGLEFRPRKELEDFSGAGDIPGYANDR